tara:strand:+ start:639 stop:1763 length:1125 start_codon:yes stop_codon:yes gene_type:complete
MSKNYKQNILGNITFEEFFQKFWGKKPLLIQNAIINEKNILNKKEILNLAKKEDVETRVIENKKNKYKLNNGPFRKVVPLKKNWTILINGANLHNEKVNQFLNKFRFIPDNYLDDLMISYACDRGGVGPHFDSYNVFLFQAFGTKIWQISNQKNLSLLPNQDLKILKEFFPSEEFNLKCGDMLYLPPKIAHNGISNGESITYSIGFKSPEWSEILESFSEFLFEKLNHKEVYSLQELKKTNFPSKIDDDLIKKIKNKINTELKNININVFLGEYFSEPKLSVFFSKPQNKLTKIEFKKNIKKLGFKLNKKTKMLYIKNYVFINGETILMPSKSKKLFINLANQRVVLENQSDFFPDNFLQIIYEWYLDGWVEIN